MFYIGDYVVIHCKNDSVSDELEEFFTYGKPYQVVSSLVSDKNYATIVNDDGNLINVSCNRLSLISPGYLKEDSNIKTGDGKVSMPIDLPLSLIKELAAIKALEIIENAVKNNVHGNLTEALDGSTESE